MSRYVYDLVVDAIDNVFDFRIPWNEPYTNKFRELVDDLMGVGFYEKFWGSQDGCSPDDVGKVTPEEIEKLKMYAGPHGKTLYKAKIARQNACNDLWRAP